jgi:hypothetical protein
MKIVKVLIWLGFTALLAVSVPKVAWVFRSYEGTSPSIVTIAAGVSIDVLWLVPLFVAICIDALILAVTYAVSVDKQKVSQGIMWAFVALLGALSYYCNLLYNFAHIPAGSIWTDWFIGTVTPFILSGVPLFALCYTLILSRIDGKGETLEQKAARLASEKVAKDRIREVTKGRFIGRIGETLRLTIAEGKETAKTLSPGKQNKPIAQASQEVKASDSESQNGDIEQGIPDIKIDDTPGHTSPYIALTPDVLAILNTYPGLASLLSTGQKTATVKEIIEALKVSPKLVANRVKSGVLKRSPRNPNLILITSVIELAKQLHSQRQKGSITSMLPVVNLAENGHQGESVTDVLELISTEEKVS